MHICRGVLFNDSFFRPRRRLIHYMNNVDIKCKVHYMQFRTDWYCTSVLTTQLLLFAMHAYNGQSKTITFHRTIPHMHIHFGYEI